MRSPVGVGPTLFIPTMWPAQDAARAQSPRCHYQPAGLAFRDLKREIVMQTSNALDPQSPLARAIYDLGIVSGIVFALIFVIVTGAIIYAIFRFRARAGEPDPKQIPGNRKVEIAWTIIPFLIVIFLLIMTLSAMNRADPPP